MNFTTILLVAVSLGVAWLFLYGLKRILDAEVYNTLTARIVALICKAEIEITGFQKGEKRLKEVVANVEAFATEKEKKLLKKLRLPSLVTTIFKSVVLPIFAHKVR